MLLPSTKSAVSFWQVWMVPRPSYYQCPPTAWSCFKTRRMTRPKILMHLIYVSCLQVLAAVFSTTSWSNIRRTNPFPGDCLISQLCIYFARFHQLIPDLLLLLFGDFIRPYAAWPCNLEASSGQFSGHSVG